MKTELNVRTFLTSLVFALILIVPYEYHFKQIEKYPRSYELESFDIWADQRAQVPNLNSEDVVILGSSRGHFDINIHVWDSLTGRRPLMLAYPGSSPFIPMEDIVNETSFNGTLIVSSAPGLFYTVRSGWGAKRGKEFVDHYYNRTYAQRFNQQIFYLYESSLSFLNNSLSLKKIIESRFILPNRDSIKNSPVWPPMVAMDKYRNIRMTPFFEKDSAMIKAQTDIWHNPNFKNKFADSVDVIINHYVSLAHKFEARGGKVVFIRPPVSEWYLTEEAEHFPREKYWDRLIDECNCLGYSYEDFKETKDMIPPEWSHLNRKDSDEYTKFLVNQLSKDKIL